ncbi:DUF2515 family protein [Halalkalibacter wakoensis]|nr:DUF2515 family protein [Halalkalibacter wakoensis]
MLKKATQIPSAIKQYAMNAFDKYRYESNNKREWERLSLESSELQKLQQKLLISSKEETSKNPLSTSDKILIAELKQKIRTHNQNNVTRTKAYLNFYLKHPEIHWAFLAHLVSRNGGWNMTDLKGDLTKALSAKRKKDFFHFLERANALIFHDAYPQLLLYEESKQQNKNLFYLLPFFHVSQFMSPIWNHFFLNKNSKLLTIALIINEQHYIENRVIQHSYFKKHVIQTPLFQAQDLFQFTKVLFPYEQTKKKRKVAGVNVTNFESVTERINVGKRLYAMVFGLNPLHQDITTFATNVPHTGSRSDYWPTVFTSKEKKKTQKASPCASNEIIYSPKLANAWNDVSHTFSDQSDWYQDSNVFSHFSAIDVPTAFDLTNDYCRHLQKLTVGAHAYKKVKKFF